MANPVNNSETKRRYHVFRTFEPRFRNFLISGLIFVCLIIAQRFYQKPLFSFSVKAIPVI